MVLTSKFIFQLLGKYDCKLILYFAALLNLAIPVFAEPQGFPRLQPSAKLSLLHMAQFLVSPAEGMPDQGGGCGEPSGPAASCNAYRVSPKPPASYVLSLSPGYARDIPGL